MVLDKETFAERLKTEPDTDYIKALLILAESWSQPWVVECLETEIAIRKDAVDQITNKEAVALVFSSYDPFEELDEE